jgi:seryl-tRNA synthetase
MLDPVLLREHTDDVRSRLDQRGVNLHEQLEFLTRLDAERRKILPVLENARRSRKEVGGQIAQAKKDGRSVDELLKAGQVHGEQIKAQEQKLERVEHERHKLSLVLPNLPHGSVPVGRTEADNTEVRRHGEPPAFNFTPQAHWDLGPALGILDFERGAKIARSRFTVLVGVGARLERALINFMLDLHTSEHGYTEIDPPFLANADALTGTGNLPKFEEDLFKVTGDWDLYLIPTAEVPLCNLHRDEILDGATLPLRYAAYTPCFRSEAGSYGKDVRGLIRQHQFDKVELVAYATPEQSYGIHEELTGHAEEVLKRLGLPFRTVVLCTGDMGFASAKTYDIEVWLPSQNTYREISSCSNTEAFQARRANIRFRRDGHKGKPELVHTLNGSGVAVGRALIAVLENGQQSDGAVVIPEVLRPYMRGQEVIEPRG